MARPSSEGGRKEAKTAAGEPEAVDWLGLSRLGSPDPSARDTGASHYDAESDEFASGFQLSPRQSQRKLSQSRDVTFSANMGDTPQPRHSTPPKTLPVKGKALNHSIITCTRIQYIVCYRFSVMYGCTCVYVPYSISFFNTRRREVVGQVQTAIAVASEGPPTLS